MEILLRRCRAALLEPGRVEEDVDILVSGGRIAGVGRGLGGGGDEIDCRRLVAMPGLVNAHTHAAMWALRGLYDRGELPEWLRSVGEAEEGVTAELVYHASRAAVAEMLMGGVTAFVDMYFHPLETARAASELGIRAYTGPVLAGEYGEGKAREVERVLAGLSRIEGVGPVVSVHALYSSSPELYRLAAEAASRWGALLATHVSETRDEVYYVKNLHGVFPVELLDRLGFLGPRTSLVHLGWVASWELRLIGERGATAVHCPSSNMKLATGGFLPLREMLDAGINVALGTDGPASNNSLDMFREMRMAVLLSRNNYWHTRVGAGDALAMATRNGYRMLGLRGGALKPGYLADIVLLDAGSPRLRPLTAKRAESHLVYSACGCDVHTVLVGGRIVYSPEARGALLEAVEEAERLASEYFG